MVLIARIEVGAKLLGVMLIFLTVRSPNDFWLAPSALACGATTAAILALGIAVRDVGLEAPTVKGALRALRLGWSMLLFRMSSTLYSTGNAFLLGLFVSPTAVGYYAGAEKITRAAISLLTPISQAVFPRISNLASASIGRAAKIARTSAIVILAAGTFGAAALVLAAPDAVHVLLGRSYETSIALIRVLALLAPLLATSNALGIQWMLPLGLDRPFNVVVIMAGILNLVLVALAVPSHGNLGMAWSVVATEAFVVGGFASYLWIMRRSPWHFIGEN